ncbi:hypothetical protein H5T53_06680 [Candidatus Bipolaricaulota bacterium]|nr:hypothetical protein [Candidatus Bipolaricaulota bacterium]
MGELTRCGWRPTDRLLVRYHDEEWGVPSMVNDHLVTCFRHRELGGAG